jgi:hypothetical protein
MIFFRYSEINENIENENNDRTYCSMFVRVVGLIDVLKKISCYIKLTFSSFSSKAYYNFLNLVPEKLN